MDSYGHFSFPLPEHGIRPFHVIKTLPEFSKGHGMIIAFCGRLKSGKDTAARVLIEKHGFKRYAYADILKEACAEAIDREEIGWTGSDWTGSKTELGRRVLQGIGHGMRKHVDPDVWVDAMERAIAINGDTTGDVVVTDCRYDNEERWVHNRKGILIRVNRPDVDRSGPEHQHPTETNVDRLNADVDITNDGTIEDLWAKVEAILNITRALKRAA